MTKTSNVLIAVCLSSFCIAGCGGNAPEPETPQERIADDEKKLEYLQDEGAGSGSEVQGEAIEKDMDEAQEELDAESAK
jgi:hypothetical protein